MMQTLRRYIFAVLLTATGSAVCGTALGVILRFISIEYFHVVRNLPYKELFLGMTGAVCYGATYGFRGGLFLGALLGFAAIGRTRKIAPIRDLQIAASIVPAATWAAALMGSAGVYTAAKLTSPFLPENIAMQVGSPYRVLCGYGLEYGACVGAIMSTLTIAVWIWCRRC